MGYAGAVAVRVNPWDLGYQLVPALGAAPREHLAAALGGHARTEPVGALAAHFARLIGTLHAVGSVDDAWLAKKGGKAKPLSVKVSIHGRLRKPSARGAIGIDSAAVSGHGGERCAQAPGAQPFRGRLDQRQPAAAHR